MLPENPLFLIPFSSGVIFIIVGFIMLKFPPKAINSIYGYRTNASMKNQERWDFAQIYSSKKMIKIGTLLSIIALTGWIYQPSENIATILGFCILLFAIIFLISMVEKKLKSKFSKDL
ncbi:MULTISPECIES: SdpI family protein [Winogradskyella]|uniref:SdpI family protein n=1 Tax=Winogradskyella TaxID=286104 RepID=UPI0015CA15D5|nr:MULTISPECIES: SdpI family protein [Winogradskyella]QXP78087.1 SdpI family protein [Winogradskyella sp. HaHa_3_26]